MPERIKCSMHLNAFLVLFLTFFLIQTPFFLFPVSFRLCFPSFQNRTKSVMKIVQHTQITSLKPMRTHFHSQLYSSGHTAKWKSKMFPFQIFVVVQVDQPSKLLKNRLFLAPTSGILFPRSSTSLYNPPLIPHWLRFLSTMHFTRLQATSSDFKHFSFLISHSFWIKIYRLIEFIYGTLCVSCLTYVFPFLTFSCLMWCPSPICVVIRLPNTLDPKYLGCIWNWSTFFHEIWRKSVYSLSHNRHYCRCHCRRRQTVPLPIKCLPVSSAKLYLAVLLI